MVFIWVGGCVVSGLVCLTSSEFSSVLFFSVGLLCVCVCARARARGLAHLVYLQEKKHFM